MEKDFWIKTQDNVDLYVKKWYKEETQPRAILQLSHGMTEHINRYDAFARFLLDHNIFVYGNDHRGHGYTGESQGMLGYFAEKDGFFKTVDDLLEVTKQIKEDYPQAPLFLFGHSMGSFLARSYIQDNSSEIDGVILAGTGYHYTTTSIIARSLARFLLAKRKSHFMNQLAFRTYNFKIPYHKTDFDWLSRDEDAVQEYIADPFAGYIPTARFFYDLMDGLAHIHRRRYNTRIRKDLPMFIVSGDADPVGHYEKGIWKVANHYSSLGLMHVKTMLFEEARHELLHEINKDEVYKVIYQWIMDNK